MHEGLMILNAAEQSEALRLARAGLERGVAAGREVVFDFESLRGEGFVLGGKFEDEYGVFVTLKKGGDLRGCIGNILPYASLAESIWGRAQDAALGDPRFPDVDESELSRISVEISVLSHPVEVGSYEEIVIGRHGVILEKGGRSSVFLPQVAPEQGWDVEETLANLCWKAGLGADSWREGARLKVFEAQVF